MSEQLIELSLVKTKLVDMTVLYGITPNNNTHLFRIIGVLARLVGSRMHFLVDMDGSLRFDTCENGIISY